MMASDQILDVVKEEVNGLTIAFVVGMEERNKSRKIPNILPE
jgi:hypothetical protein